MNYEEKYKQAIDNIKKIKDANKDNTALVDFIEYNYPELKENEDEKKLKELMSCFEKWEIIPEYTEEIKTWIEGLIEKQKKVEWGEKDEGIKNCLIATLCEEEHGGYDTNKRFVDWLKSLRLQKQCFIATEEELTVARKDAFNEVLDKIEYYSGEPTFEDGWYAALKFVRQKQWRPSEEQLECLKETIVQTKGYVYSWYLPELYEELKKL